MDAQVVYERQVGGDIQHGPAEYIRVGVRFDDRVVWLGSAYFPGDDGRQYKQDEGLAKEIVRRWYASPT